MTQQERILNILREAKGQWVCGQYFNDAPVRISQYHTRIHELQKKYKIEASDFKNEYGFKSYRLAGENTAEAFMRDHPTVERNKVSVLF